MVCGTYADDNGNFSSPYIKSGTITLDRATHTLTLNNTVIEYSSNNPSDNVYPIRVTENATIVIQGACKLQTTGHVALALDGYEGKSVTIQGNGSLNTSSTWIDIFLVCTHLTIKDITLETATGIGNNATGSSVGLNFNHVQALIRGSVSRIGDGITFKNCSITYPEDAHIGHMDYGYYIYYGNNKTPDYIVISRTVKIPGDVNGDGEVNIADINAVIDAILSDNGDLDYDANNDGEVNIADINTIIDIILNPNQGRACVDLGLPSGTLWATCNVGANSPEEPGYYFAWVETMPKQVYDWDSYVLCYYDENGILKLTKYNNDILYGTVDNKTELDPADDAAAVNWGRSWCMPTTEQQQELIDNCTWQ